MPDTLGDGKKKELSMEMRLLIAFLLMGLVLFVTPYLYKGANQPAPKGPQNVTPNTAAEMTKTPSAEQPKPAPEAVSAQQPAAEAQASSEQPVTIDTALYRVVFSNRGATVHSWILKKYQDMNGKP